MATLNEILTQLEEVTKELNVLSSSLGEFVKDLEARLGRIGVAYPLWLEGSAHLLARDENETSLEGETSYVAWRLGYTRYAGQWAIALKTVKVVGGADPERAYGQPVTFSSAPRHVRVAAAPHLISLCQEVLDRAITMRDHLRAYECTSKE